MTGIRFCVDCGADISARGPQAKRCEGCARIRDNVLNRIRKSGRTETLESAWTTPPKQCRGCIYLDSVMGFCDYYNRTGQLRTSLHPHGTDINNPCRERKLRDGVDEGN